MDPNDNPYDILGVPQTATAAEIKTAYRRRALETHPDKQQLNASEEDRQRATALFAKLSNAYELLSDPVERQNYDQQQQQQQQQQQSSFTATPGFMPTFPASDWLHQFVMQHVFHDPFQVFEQVFQEDDLFTAAGFGGRSTAAGLMGNNNMMGSGGGGFEDFSTCMFGSSVGFEDFSTSMFGGGMMRLGGGGGVFGGLGGGFGGGFGGSGGLIMGPSLFGNGGFNNAFGSTVPSLSAGGQHVMFSSSTNSSHMAFGSSSSTTTTSAGGDIVTVQTTMQSINGQPPQQVTERIVQKANGTVERSVVTQAPERTGRLQQLPPPPPTTTAATTRTSLHIMPAQLPSSESVPPQSPTIADNRNSHGGVPYPNGSLSVATAKTAVSKHAATGKRHARQQQESDDHVDGPAVKRKKAAATAVHHARTDAEATAVDPAALEATAVDQQNNNNRRTRNGHGHSTSRVKHLGQETANSD